MDPNEIGKTNLIDSRIRNQVPIDHVEGRALREDAGIKAGQQSVDTSAISETTLSEVSAALNNRLLTLDRRVDVGVDKESGHYIVTVYDTRHDVVVMQLPPESFLKLSKSLDRLTGILMDARG